MNGLCSLCLATFHVPCSIFILRFLSHFQCCNTFDYCCLTIWTNPNRINFHTIQITTKSTEHQKQMIFQIFFLSFSRIIMLLRAKFYFWYLKNLLAGCLNCYIHTTYNDTYTPHTAIAFASTQSMLRAFLHSKIPIATLLI